MSLNDFKFKGFGDDDDSDDNTAQAQQLQNDNIINISHKAKILNTILEQREDQQHVTPGEKTTNYFLTEASIAMETEPQHTEGLTIHKDLHTKDYAKIFDMNFSGDEIYHVQQLQKRPSQGGTASELLGRLARKPLQGEKKDVKKVNHVNVKQEMRNMACNFDHSELIAVGNEIVEIFQLRSSNPSQFYIVYKKAKKIKGEELDVDYQLFMRIYNANIRILRQDILLMQHYVDKDLQFAQDKKENYSLLIQGHDLYVIDEINLCMFNKDLLVLFNRDHNRIREATKLSFIMHCLSPQLQKSAKKVENGKPEKPVYTEEFFIVMRQENEQMLGRFRIDFKLKEVIPIYFYSCTTSEKFNRNIYLNQIAPKLLLLIDEIGLAQFITFDFKKKQIDDLDHTKIIKSDKIAQIPQQGLTNSRKCKVQQITTEIVGLFSNDTLKLYQYINEKLSEINKISIPTSFRRQEKLFTHGTDVFINTKKTIHHNGEEKEICQVEIYSLHSKKKIMQLKSVVNLQMENIVTNNLAVESEYIINFKKGLSRFEIIHWRNYTQRQNLQYFQLSNPKEQISVQDSYFLVNDEKQKVIELCKFDKVLRYKILSKICLHRSQKVEAYLLTKRLNIILLIRQDNTQFIRKFMICHNDRVRKNYKAFDFIIKPPEQKNADGSFSSDMSFFQITDLKHAYDEFYDFIGVGFKNLYRIRLDWKTWEAKVDLLIETNLTPIHGIKMSMEQDFIYLTDHRKNENKGKNIMIDVKNHEIWSELELLNKLNLQTPYDKQANKAENQRYQIKFEFSQKDNNKAFLWCLNQNKQESLYEIELDLMEPTLIADVSKGLNSCGNGIISAIYEYDTTTLLLCTFNEFYEGQIQVLKYRDKEFHRQNSHDAKAQLQGSHDAKQMATMMKTAAVSPSAHIATDQYYFQKDIIQLIYNSGNKKDYGQNAICNFYRTSDNHLLMRFGSRVCDLTSYGALDNNSVLKLINVNKHQITHHTYSITRLNILKDQLTYQEEFKVQKQSNQTHTLIQHNYESNLNQNFIDLIFEQDHNKLVQTLNDMDSRFYFEAFSCFKGRNMVHFFANDSDILEILFKSYDSSSHPNAIIRDFEGHSPIDLAFQDKALKSINIMLKFLSTEQDNIYSGYLLNKSLVLFIKEGLDICCILDSNICNHQIKDLKMPEMGDDKTRYFDCKHHTIWDVPYNHEEIIPEKHTLVKTSKVEYYITVLPEMLSHRFLQKTFNNRVEHSEIFQIPAFQNVIDYNWNQVKDYYRMKLLIFMFILVIVILKIFKIDNCFQLIEYNGEELNVNCERFYFKEIEGSDLSDEIIATLDERQLTIVETCQSSCPIQSKSGTFLFGCTYLIVLYQMYLILFEQRQLIQNQKLKFFSNIGNIFSIAFNISYLQTVILDYVEYVSQDFYVLSYILLLFFLCLYLLNLSRIFKSIGFILRILLETTGDILYYVIFMLLLIFFFGMIYWIVGVPVGDQYFDNRVFGYSFVIFRTSLGEFDTEDFEDITFIIKVMIYIIWVILIIMNNIIFANLLISVVSNSYSKVNSTTEVFYYMQKLGFVIEQIQMNRIKNTHSQHLLKRQSIVGSSGGDYTTWVQDLQNCISVMEQEQTVIISELQDKTKDALKELMAQCNTLSDHMVEKQYANDATNELLGMLDHVKTKMDSQFIEIGEELSKQYQSMAQIFGESQQSNVVGNMQKIAAEVEGRRPMSTKSRQSNKKSFKSYSAYSESSYQDDDDFSDRHNGDF